MSFPYLLVSLVHVVLVKSRHVLEMPTLFIDALASTILSIFLDVTIVMTLAVALIVQNQSLFLMTLTVVPLYVLIILAFYKLFEKKIIN